MNSKIIKDNYEKTYWVDNETVVDARKLNKLEQQMEVVTGDLILQNDINSAVQDQFDKYYNKTIIDEKLKEIQKGSQGEKGEPGERGPQGLTGAQGPQGIPGEKGDPGRDGEQGPRGETGPVGPAGQAGKDGQDGKDGKSVSILGSKDSVEELPPSGEKGDAYLVNGDLHVWNGEEWDNVGRIQGPAGPIGPVGPAGKDGPRGLTGERGPSGSSGERGPRGLQGPPGEGIPPYTEDDRERVLAVNSYGDGIVWIDKPTGSSLFNNVGGYNYIKDSDRELKSSENSSKTLDFEIVDKENTMKYIQGQSITISCEVEGDVDLENCGVVFSYQLQGHTEYVNCKAELITQSSGKKRLWATFKLP